MAFGVNWIGTDGPDVYTGTEDNDILKSTRSQEEVRW